LVAILILSGIPGLTAAYTPAKGETRQAGLDLLVGGQDEMKTRNLLPAIANDVWTSDVHYRIYDSLIQPHPTVDRPMAWIAKGVDFNENGVFETSEYDVWAEQTGTLSPLGIVIYYDFNGVMWHDGVQMTPWDFFFSYHVNAQNSRFITDMRVLLRDGTTSSYEGGSRQMNIALFDSDTVAAGVQRVWEDEASMFGGVNNALRIGVQFNLTESFALFYESTIAPVMLPMHIWSRTGGGRHAADFGCAVWIPQLEATARGIPECGNANPATHGKGIASSETVTGSSAYVYSAADAWALSDADVIGHGPFTFDQWVPGVEAHVVRNENFYTGVSGTTVYDARLASILQLPTITGIRYKVYKTTQIGVFALQSGEVDFYHWNVGAEFVPDLLKIPEIAVESNAEPGFFYMGYNLRESPWGYQGNDPSDDVGLGFRQAVSHLIDKRSIVQNLLQNFGVVGHGMLSPANTFWYNDNIPKPGFDLAAANAILDDLATPGGQYTEAGFTLDPAGPCHKDNDGGCRSLPVMGNAEFEILTPQADYDPVRASAGAMIADAMRQVGINAVSRPTAFGQIVALITAHNFDMYILGWRIGGTDPDYLYSFFHSINAPTGQNYVGFNNATFDAKISASRAELDRDTRQTLIRDAQLTLAEARPYDVLYYRTNIEGYRQDRFVNWTVTSGTIWNFWSLQGIHPPSGAGIVVVMTAASAMASAGLETVTVNVFDNTGQALAGASVTLTVGAGNLTIGATTARSVVDTTNGNGEVTATYRADVVGSETPVIVDAAVDASSVGFPDGVLRSTQITVFPAGVQFLSLTLELPLGDRVTSGSDLPLRITARDQDRVLVPDALVSMIVSPAGSLTPIPASGAAVDMSAVTLRAAAGIAVSTPYSLNVTAEKAGYVDAAGGRQVTIVPPDVQMRLCPDGNSYPVTTTCPTVSTPGLEVLPILAGIGIAALVAGVVAERKRRS
jgi:ABC-type transport system substrate-binding protein